MNPPSPRPRADAATTTLLAFAAAVAGLIAGAGPPGDDALPWRELLSFRPPAAVQRAVIDRGRDWAVHRIEDASGPVSLDAYTIFVDVLPEVDGRRLTAAGLLAHVRRHLGDFADPGRALFSPMTAADAATWRSDDPTGAVLLIDMKLGGLSPDSGCVVIARSTPEEWIFSTVRAGAPGMVAVLTREVAAAHPLSGNRSFGWSRRDEGRYLFYTTAADRPTRAIDAAASRVAFAAADGLWRDFQNRLAAFVNAHGGKARVGGAKAIRHDWDAVRTSAYSTAGQPAWVRIVPRP
jgi:hypothetical protein